MTFRHALLAALLFAAPAAAQRGESRGSHVPVPRAPGTNPERMLAELTQQMKLRGDLTEMLEKLRGGNPNNMAEVSRRLQELLRDNPELAQRLREMAGQNPDAFAGLLDSVRRDNPDLPRTPLLQPSFMRKYLEGLTRPDGGQEGPGKSDSRRSDGPPADEPKTPTRPRPSRPTEARPPAPDQAEQRARDAWARDLAKLAERFDPNKLPDKLKDSPAVSHLLDNLAKAGSDALRNSSAREGLDAQLARWQRRLEGMKDWLPDRLPDRLFNIDPSRLPNLPRPNINMPRFNVRPPNLSAPGGLGVSGAGMMDIVQGVLMLLLAAAVGVVLWRVLGSRSAEGAARRALGPWPLDPSQVATREELIRAFEYLSVLQCGEKARSWHHRAIAAGLGGTVSERRSAAERLASLYEQARYAPDAATLAEPAFADARRHLTFLAGAGA